MPKATKKKKEKAADFSKAKLKLGKGKQLPSNQVDTSFKARSIALPSQSIAQGKDTTTPTTKRRLTLDDLLAHLKHYSAAVRRDAIFGLRELLEAHFDLVEPSLTRLFGACVRLIGNEDTSVRKALLTFFSWLLPLLPPDRLEPHTPLILLFTTSAQTHIFPEIQLDAVRMLDVLLDATPATVVGEAHNRRVLQGYLSLLSAGTKFGEDGDDGPPQATSTASVVLSAASKRAVLRSLAKFLRITFAKRTEADPSSSAIPTWYLSSSFVSPDAFEAFETILRAQPSKTRIWRDDPGLGVQDDAFIADLTAEAESVTSWTLQELSGFKTGAEPSQSDHIAKIARTLHPVLLSAYLDAAPTAFAPGAVVFDSDIGIVNSIADIYQTLYGVILQRSTPGNDIFEELQTLLGHMAAYFPSRQHEAFNLAFCALAALLSLSPASARPKARVHAQRVAEYVVELLQGGDASDILSRPVTAQIYVALLPTAWALLNSDAESLPIMNAILEHAQRVPAMSAASPLTIEFIARLVLLETERGYQGKWALSRDVDVSQVQRWILSLLKTVWEIGSTNPRTSEAIFRLLLRLVQQRSSLVNDQVVERLAPFFASTHPTRGEILGPFNKISDATLRRLALDVAATLLRSVPSAEASTKLAHAVQKATVGGTEEEYWISMRNARIV